jgi:hypothetical protein
MTPRGISAVLLLAGLARVSQGAAPPVRERAPDALLPATTQVYLRWDGERAHRAAYGRSAIGKMLAGELGRSIRAIWGRFESDLHLRVVGSRLLEGASSEDLQRRSDLLSACVALPRALAETGFIAGFEAHIVPPPAALFRGLARVAAGKAGVEELALPHVQFTLVFPGAKNRPEMIALLDRLSAFEKTGAIQRVIVDGRTCRVVKGSRSEVGWAWWLEGTHLVVVAAPGDPARAVARVPASGPGVTGTDLYRALAGFRGFEVTSRGFVDGRSIASAVRWLRLTDPLTLAVVEDTGLLDVQALRLWEGFEGEASRACWEVDFPARQRGISRFLVNKALDRKSLPPLPADAHRWTAARTNVAALHDLFLTLAAPSVGEAPEPSLFGTSRALARAKERARREFDDALGVKVGDVLATLGDTFVTYCSPSDGIAAVGQVGAVAVRDEATLNRYLDPLGRKIAALLGERVRFRKRSFHGVTIREIGVAEGGSPVSLTCAVHRGWLVLALNQQPIQGFILRSKGKLPAWQPDERTARALARVPADAGLVQVVDPRPSVTFALAGAPLLAGLLGRAESFRHLIDPGDLPHAGEVTRHLFPNVSWTSFDGRTFRIESRESLWLPLQEVGVESLVILSGRF